MQDRSLSTQEGHERLRIVGEDQGEASGDCGGAFACRSSSYDFHRSHTAFLVRRTKMLNRVGRRGRSEVSAIVSDYNSASVAPTESCLISLDRGHF